MKKGLNNVPKLKSENGALSGGFASLDASQMNKIKGGLKKDANTECQNSNDCTSGNNSSCTNSGAC